MAVPNVWVYLLILGAIFCLFCDAFSNPELPNRRLMPAVFLLGNKVIAFPTMTAQPILEAGRMRPHDDIGALT